MFPVGLLFDDQEDCRFPGADPGVMNRLPEGFINLTGEFNFDRIVFGEAVYPAAIGEGDFSLTLAPGVTVGGFFVEVGGLGCGGEEKRNSDKSDVFYGELPLLIGSLKISSRVGRFGILFRNI